ncbi:DeoR/GlpR family DNA-binding transcription regulator [Cohnella terricola]|uniref:Lactose phosphotransferase system repressor n=1 Tax=Cohnella terricola TaxID=1289167 RepID=A0A559J8N3_9BACL|nr:DeoR/GlpR family DNA-binding transcription regulator [Cohnella terricola]TVX96248.1 DeoR/GlpR transcriptional regulator [Cohnella terricola]
MLREERHQLILHWLRNEQKVVATDLIHRLQVSEDTVRRDLRELDKAGLLRRVHGGALLIGPPLVDFDERRNVAASTKTLLAKKALQLVHNGQVILIDGGTTNVQFALHLPLDLHATVITNSPPITDALKSHPHIDVILLGGQLYKHSMVTLGASTMESLNDIKVDLYVLGVYHLHPQTGISYPNQEEALVKRKMISVATEVAALATSDKLSSVSSFIAAPASALTYLITEEQIESNLVDPYLQLHITVL